MPHLRNLTPEEYEIFLHKVRNQGRVLGDNFTGEILDEMTSQEIEKKLAKISEETTWNSTTSEIS